MVFRFALVFIPLLFNSVSKGVMFLGCPSHPFIHSSGEIIWPWYLTNGWSILIKQIESIH